MIDGSGSRGGIYTRAVAILMALANPSFVTPRRFPAITATSGTNRSDCRRLLNDDREARAEVRAHW